MEPIWRLSTLRRYSGESGNIQYTAASPGLLGRPPSRAMTCSLARRRQPALSIVAARMRRGPAIAGRILASHNALVSDCGPTQLKIARIGQRLQLAFKAQRIPLPCVVLID